MSAFTIMAVLNFGIVGAYLTIGTYIAPRIGVLPSAAQMLATLFFYACAMTHLDMAFHCLSHSGRWLAEPHMLIIHGVQVVVDWAFIIVARRALDHPALSAAAEDGLFVYIDRILADPNEDQLLALHLRRVLDLYGRGKKTP